MELDLADLREKRTAQGMVHQMARPRACCWEFDLEIDWAVLKGKQRNQVMEGPMVCLKACRMDPHWAHWRETH